MFPEYPPKAMLPKDEVDAIWDIVGRTAASVRNMRSLPSLLYHYTDANGLCGIVGSGVLRATHISYMNDVREYWSAITAFRNEAEATKPESSFQTQLLAQFRKLRDDSDPYFMPRLFVACFSTDKDSLNQWRAYGRGKAGYAIGFDSRAISDALKGALAWLMPAVYNKDDQRKFVRLLLHEALAEYPKRAARLPPEKQDDHLRHWVESFFMFASFLAPVLKDPAFEEEREWRIIYTPNYLAEIKIAPNPILSLSAYVDLPLGSEKNSPADLPADARKSTSPKTLPIKEIQVGPGQFKRIAQTATTMLLTNSGYDGVIIEPSSVPYRGT